MAFCSKCGTELLNQSKFCPQCGNPIEEGKAKPEEPKVESLQSDEWSKWVSKYKLMGSKEKAIAWAKLTTDQKAHLTSAYKLTPPPPPKKGKGCLISLAVIVGFIILLALFGKYEQWSNEKEVAEQQKQEQQKKQKSLDEFMGAIDTHYEELLNLLEGKSSDKALEKIGLFEKFDRGDYKDVAQIKIQMKKESLTEKISKLPASNIKDNLDAYNELLSLDPDNQLYKDKIADYQSRWDAEEKRLQEEAYRLSCDLELVSGGWSTEYSYAIYEGQIKNTSNKALRSVEAVVTWYDATDNMITSDSALIEYNPILPGQTSPFKVMKTYNPAMKKASVEFKHLIGGTIKTYRK